METYYKYPRTPHLPWSIGASIDDVRIFDTHHFSGKNVVVTIKRDGENSTAYGSGKVHARSIDSRNHPSRNWLKRLVSEIQFDIPVGWRIVFENLYAEHTIKYNNLHSYVEVIGIWDEHNVCLSWTATKEWCMWLDLVHVPVLYEGIYDETLIKGLYSDYDTYGDPMEGYVVRLADAFNYADFLVSVAKFVSMKFKMDLDGSGDKHWLEKHKCGVIRNRLQNNPYFK
jgi:hypothetical protein